MKRLLLAVGVVSLTFILGIFAVAVAQKDARNRLADLPEGKPAYSNQVPEPLSLDPTLDPSFSTSDAHIANDRGLRQAPPPLKSTSNLIVRANDEASPQIGLRRVSDVSSEVVTAAAFDGPPAFNSTQSTPSPMQTPPLMQTPPTLMQAPPRLPAAQSNPPQALPSLGSGQPNFPSPLGNAESAKPFGTLVPQPPSLTTTGITAQAIPSAEPAYGNMNSQRNQPPSRIPPSPSTKILPGMTPIGNRTLAPNETQMSKIRLVSDTPGHRQLEGAQNPNIQLQKIAPSEIQVGQNAPFSIIVRNVGNATAHDVTVVDQIPRGTRLATTEPQAAGGHDGQLVWSLGEIAAGGDRTLKMELVPETEGEIGSVATVTFAAQASVRTLSTQPILEIKQVIEPSVLIGEEVTIQITVTNRGTGVAREVVLQEEIPAGLRSKDSNDNGFNTYPFDLAPGQSKNFPLRLMAAEPGSIRHSVRAISQNAAAIESIESTEVVSPRLEIAMSGPGLRYLENQAIYKIVIKNAGTAIARNIDVVANLPAGLQFNSAGNGGAYVASKHAVGWGLEELAVGATAITELTVMPVREGDFVVRLQGQGDGVRANAIEKRVRIEGQSELAFTVEDNNDPIEINGQTIYTVRLTNNGTRADHQVEMSVDLPDGAQDLQVNAPTRYVVRGKSLEFEPIPEMRAKDEYVFQIAVRLEQEGIKSLRVFVKSQLRPAKVVKEESTQVYSDR